jgi:hypothetical protein
MANSTNYNQWMAPSSLQSFMPGYSNQGSSPQAGPSNTDKWHSGIFSNQSQGPSMANNFQASPMGNNYQAPSMENNWQGAGTADNSAYNFGMQPPAAAQPGMPGAGLYNGEAGGFKEGFLGGVDDAGNKTAGWGGLALGGAQAGIGAYLGMKQYGLAKDSFKQGKKEFQMNWDANRKMTNSRLEDRQRMRVASQPGSHQSVADYMAKNGI